MTNQSDPEFDPDPLESSSLLESPDPEPLDSSSDPLDSSSDPDPLESSFDPSEPSEPSERLEFQQSPLALRKSDLEDICSMSWASLTPGTSKPQTTSLVLRESDQEEKSKACLGTFCSQAPQASAGRSHPGLLESNLLSTT
jgi:hypothetical protein